MKVGASNASLMKREMTSAASDRMLIRNFGFPESEATSDVHPMKRTEFLKREIRNFLQDK